MDPVLWNMAFSEVFRASIDTKFTSAFRYQQQYPRRYNIKRKSVNFKNQIVLTNGLPNSNFSTFTVDNSPLTKATLIKLLVIYSKYFF